MKKLILSAVVAFAAMTANAQVWIGGGLGFTQTNYDNLMFEPDQTSFYIAPEIGYTLNDKWDLAISIGDTYTSFDPGDSSNNFFVSPYARYTFFKTGKVGFFLDGLFAVQAGDDPTEWAVGIRPGVKFAASDKVTFVASFGFLGYSKAEDQYDRFGFEFNGNGPDNPFKGGLSFGCYYSF